MCSHIDTFSPARWHQNQNCMPVPQICGLQTEREIIFYYYKNYSNLPIQIYIIIIYSTTELQNYSLNI